MVFISAYNKRLLNLQLLSSNLLSTAKWIQTTMSTSTDGRATSSQVYSLPRGDSWPHTHHVNAWVIDKSQKIGSILTVEKASTTNQTGEITQPSVARLKLQVVLCCNVSTQDVGCSAWSSPRTESIKIYILFFYERNYRFQCVEIMKLQRQYTLYETPKLQCTRTNAKWMVSKLWNAYNNIAWYTFSSNPLLTSS